ncbi:Inosine/uridine-preferring nucleoside hydrolase [Stanieria cyanosphaera PCC 7437]|uniref:Inosine/uridine-preferring nucleoside hydrolase n=1 Tax=Stanieria cyanosphaera (strain ATCC 29371 / PCC 7437) TaxID=111780 RepID=K9XVL8_STAC7|nr:nucleoside hydrolase [Stanieria cyanosphaera]AFZ36568.1 Inosine/uridine-preferring nucleoside hydrolase [Stanieria cyanosphaera PCC 7437]
MSKKLVLMDHDGAIDDFLATILLLTMAEVEPIGIVVTPADCYPRAAVSVTRKILDLMGKSHISVAASTVRGINPFPPEFRRDCTIIDNFPILNEPEQSESRLVTESGQEFIVNQLQAASQPVSLMVTGPLTTLAEAIILQPEIIAKIEAIIWMGGALTVGGNVEKGFALEHDGSAEWNVFWDPIAAKKIWETSIAIILCPLDLTNTVPVTPEFIHLLTKQRQYPLSDLAGLCYALAIPQTYYCWDILATAYLARPEFYHLETYETDIITEGTSQGRTILKQGGRTIQVMTKVDKQRFYDYLLKQLKALK